VATQVLVPGRSLEGRNYVTGSLLVRNNRRPGARDCRKDQSNGNPSGCRGSRRQAGEMDAAAHRVSQKSRNALNGAILGSIIGMLFGCAVLITIGFEASPGLFEAMLLVACSALGGGIFGAIVGSTGIFAAERITPALKRHFEAEIGHGRTVIFVRLKNIAQRDRLMTALNGWDDTDIHYSGNQAA